METAWRRRGAGGALFRRFPEEITAERVTVNASPYAVEIYRHLRFRTKESEQITDGLRYPPMEYLR